MNNEGILWQNKSHPLKEDGSTPTSLAPLISYGFSVLPLFTACFFPPSPQLTFYCYRRMETPRFRDPWLMPTCDHWSSWPLIWSYLRRNREELLLSWLMERCPSDSVSPCVNFSQFFSNYDAQGHFRFSNLKEKYRTFDIDFFFLLYTLPQLCDFNYYISVRHFCKATIFFTFLHTVAREVTSQQTKPSS